MATLEDKIAGDKLHYYCSSSEEDNDADDVESKDENGKSRNDVGTSCPMPELPQNQNDRAGMYSTNTGPKGVVKDWQRYQKLQAEKRLENEKQCMEMAKKLSMTTTTTQEDEARKQEEEIDAELAELMSEDFLQEFQKQRMTEMMKKLGHFKNFEKVFNLTSHKEFLEAIENENKHTTIIIHIYDKNLPACITLNKCFDTLAKEYPTIKFGKICSSVAGMSRDFRSKGLPALLVYKDGRVIGNFVRITDELTDDFFPSDLESFLIENGMIIDKNLYNM